MTAFTTLNNGNASVLGSGANAAGYPGVTVIEATFDASKRALAQNDTIDLADIPAGTLVMAAQWEVVGTEGAARNFSVGDTSSATAFVGSTSANSATSGAKLAMTLSEGTPNTVAAVYYAAADKLRLAAVTSGGLVAAKIKVKLVVMVAGL